MAEAVRRGEQLDPYGREHAMNPSTGVWVLAKNLLEYAR